MAPSQGKEADFVARIKLALAAWSDLDVSTLAEHLSDHVVFGSPSTEWFGERGWTEGKSEVLRRFARERSNFPELQLVEILVGSGRATILLKDGDRLMTCIVELDEDRKFSRLISFYVAPPGQSITLRNDPETGRPRGCDEGEEKA